MSQIIKLHERLVDLISKVLDRSKNTGPFNLRFSIFGRIFSGVLAPFAILFPPCIVAHA